MLLVETAEKGHVDRNPDYKKKREKELEKLGYYLLRINPDKPGFNDYEEFGRVSAYIAESIKKQTKKSLINDLSKRLLELEFKSNHSIKSKCLNWAVKNILPKNRKYTIKEKNNKNCKTIWNNVLFCV